MHSFYRFQRTRSQSGSEKGTPSRSVLAQKILQQSREAESALSDALVRFGLSVLG